MLITKFNLDSDKNWTRMQHLEYVREPFYSRYFGQILMGIALAATFAPLVIGWVMR